MTIGKGVYWVGQNGKIYMKAQGLNGVQQWQAPLLSPDKLGLTQIADPMVQTSSGDGSGGSSSSKPLNSAAVGATQQAIRSLGTEQRVGYRNIEDDYNSLIGKYNKEAERNKTDYNDENVNNNQDLLKNKQNALLAAAQGRRGLRGTLAALGALSGTGSELADRTVTAAANQDIGGAADTFAGNAQTLDKAYKRFEDEDKDRRKEAQTARVNQRTALEGSIAGKRQDFYQKMAELFANAGDNAASSTWLNRAGGLNETIAQKSRVGSTPFTARAAAYTPGDLESYLAGAGDLTVKVGEGAAGGQNPTSILAGRQRDKRRERALATA